MHLFDRRRVVFHQYIVYFEQLRHWDLASGICSTTFSVGLFCLLVFSSRHPKWGWITYDVYKVLLFSNVTFTCPPGKYKAIVYLPFLSTECSSIVLRCIAVGNRIKCNCRSLTFTATNRWFCRIISPLTYHWIFLLLWLLRKIKIARQDLCFSMRVVTSNRVKCRNLESLRDLATNLMHICVDKLIFVNYGRCFITITCYC